jgi:endonuclease/exonuclease/phosphatase (EEP) superfamily protein YafD
VDERRRLRSIHRALAVLAVLATGGCATVSEVDRAWFETNGKVAAVPLGCGTRAPLAGPPGRLPGGRPLAVVSWNIHRNADAGWRADLARFAASSDIVLLQEATLVDELRALFAQANRHWVHADAWALDDIASGVLTASIAAPVEACVQRVREPLITLPKSVLIAWYRIDGRSDTLAVANVHSINFTLELGAYQDQLDAVAAVLATHRGPVILAGDFNTWSPVRVEALNGVAARIGLVEARPARGERSRFLGMPADYLFVRGLTVDDAWVESVTSSDHAPIRATLRFTPP